MAVFVLQLLPIRQAINYFFDNNITVEEIVHTTKNPVKPPGIVDEDHPMTYFDFTDHPFFFGKNILSSLYLDMLPSSPADDVETPPPNNVPA